MLLQFFNVISVSLRNCTKLGQIFLNMNHECFSNPIYLIFIIIPHTQRCWCVCVCVGGVYWFHSIHSSVRPSVPHPVTALYRLQFCLDPFRIYTSYQATSEGVSLVKFFAKFKNLIFWTFFLICNFEFVLFDLESDMSESRVWLFMRRWGVSQNTGVLVVLVVICFWCLANLFMHLLNNFPLVIWYPD